ncbi:MAG: hypothetical protein IJT31_00375 [Oscillibacter sp.]|nr:hypothetical protein [Oscillibacter sp.]
MANLRLKVVENDTPSVECEYPSLNQMMGRDAYLYTLYKQGLAYHIMYNQEIIGGCMVRLIMVRVKLDDGTEGQFPACEIPYLVLEKSKRGKKVPGTNMTIGEVIMNLLINQISNNWARKIPIRYVVIEVIEDEKKRLQSWYERKFRFLEYRRGGKGTEHLGNVSMMRDLADANFRNERMLSCCGIQFGMLHDYEEEYYVKPHELDFPMCFARRRLPKPLDGNTLEILRAFLDWLETVPVRFFMMEFSPDLRDWYHDRGLQEYQGEEYPDTMYKDFLNREVADEAAEYL